MALKTLAAQKRLAQVHSRKSSPFLVELFQTLFRKCCNACSIRVYFSLSKHSKMVQHLHSVTHMLTQQYATATQHAKKHAIASPFRLLLVTDATFFFV